MNDKKPYDVSYDEFIRMVEDISSRLTEQITAPLYADFKKLHPIDLSDSKIASSREYKQLVTCELSQILIRQHLLYGMYYENILIKYMETNKLSKIEDIEETTYENFQHTKFKLKKEGKDEPYYRLDETNKLSNSHAVNEQIKYGSGIYLTKDGIEKNQISWEDEQNAKSEV